MSESWTLSKAKFREFNSFHNRVARYLCNKHITQLKDRTWDKEILEESGLYTIDHYIKKRRESVPSFVKRRVNRSNLNSNGGGLYQRMTYFRVAKSSKISLHSIPSEIFDNLIYAEEAWLRLVEIPYLQNPNILIKQKLSTRNQAIDLISIICKEVHVVGEKEQDSTASISIFVLPCMRELAGA